MHSIIEDHPEFAAITEARAKALVDRDAWTEAAQKRQKAFEAASLHALETGGTIPDAPQNPMAGQQAYHDRTRQLDGMERDWCAANAAGIEAALLGREDEIVARAAEILVELDTMVAELTEIRSGLAKAHQAGGGGFLYPRSTGVTIGLLIESARRDTRMMREPFTPDFGANRAGAMGEVR